MPRFKTFYKYRKFDSTTIDMLCNDDLFFASPDTFNDPLDCNFGVVCDSEISELRDILENLITKFEKSKLVEHLQAANINVDSETASKHIQNQCKNRASRKLQELAYYATNPDYSDDIIENEKNLLTHSIRNELSNHYSYGICCFSSSYHNPVLWSHYGDEHAGICIGYTENRNPRPTLRQVNYGGERTIPTSILYKAFVDKNEHAQSSIDDKVLLQKASSWRYEKEWRLIGPQGLHNSPLLMKEITFGLICPDSVKHATIQALINRRESIKFYEIYIVRNSYKLKRREVNIDELEHYFPRTAESGIEMFGEFEE